MKLSLSFIVKRICFTAESLETGTRTQCSVSEKEFEMRAEEPTK